MSIAVALPPKRRISIRSRSIGLLAVGIARLLVRGGSPARIRDSLRRLHAGCRPASHGEAQVAHAIVTTVSRRCAGRDACLLRSVATAVCCRLHGARATWVVGVKTSPFAAHAWIEADGRPVGEDTDPRAAHIPIMTV